MDGLDVVANVAEIIGAAIVIGGVVFAVVQIHDFRRQRFELATLEIVRTFQSPELNRASGLVWGLPDDLSLHEMSKLDREVQDAVRLVAATYESLGVLVHRRVVSLELVGDLMGGSVETTWAKIKPMTFQLREALSQRNIYEWFQWLAERLEDHGYSARQPPYVAHANWKPGP